MTNTQSTTAPNPHRRWKTALFIAYAALLVLALALRLLTYDRYLPLLDYSDESNMFLFSMDMRGVDEAPLADNYGAYLTSDWLAGYPPLYLWLGVWGQRLVDATSSTFVFPGDYVGAMRLLSVAANVLTVGGLLWLGWAVARPLGQVWAAVAGWLTALPYALNPQAVDVGNLAIPDSLIPLACVIALLGAVLAIQRDHAGWLVVSLLGAIAAIYLKYSLLFALWVTLCAVVVMLRRRGLRRMLPWVALLALVSAITAGYLLFGYGALGLQNQEAEGFRERGLANMVNLDRNLTNLWVALDVSTGLWLFVAVVVLGGLAYAAANRTGRTRVNLRWLWLLLPYIIGNALLTSSVVYANLERGGYGRVRFMFPAALAFSLLWALLATQIGLWGTVRRPRATRYAPVMVAAALTALFAVPALYANARLIQRYALPHTNLLLWQWSDATLPPEGKILVARDSRAHNVWNRPYSGYDGSTTFEWAHDDNPQSDTPMAAYEAGISYFVLTDTDRQQIYTGDEFARYLDALWHLKTFTAVDGYVIGETTHIYRMLPPQQAADATFGEHITLVGYDLNTTEVTPGAELRFRPYWQANATPQANYSMFVHLYPAGEPSNIIAQADGTPVTEQRLPPTWTDPNERLIGADITLATPPDAPPGDYTLALGLYDFQTGARLPVGSDDRFTVGVAISAG